MYLVSKAATRTENQCRRMLYFRSARAAFLAYMQAVGISASSKILLPAYIGWSSREGSGVYDPIREIGATPIFYRVTGRLQIDVEDAKKRISDDRPDMMLLIHYFGVPDPNAAALAGYAKSAGVLVVEDEAHAMLSDVVGGLCGRWGHASLYSLHKLLPYPDGGALVINDTAGSVISEPILRKQQIAPIPFFDYNLHAIAHQRRQNAEVLAELLFSSDLPIEVLHSDGNECVIPQSLPVCLQGVNRDELYFQMNDAGFGVVSLYHTLIDAIRPDQYPESFRLSRNILNLPVHQDTDVDSLRTLFSKLSELITETHRVLDARTTTV